ncbi:MAG TPA: hypothetical protein VN541_22785 [Tepidisphaeraceae bacterium]|nr:hypothetical protein [Tepidisphaeraceae bacterium]
MQPDTISESFQGSARLFRRPAKAFVYGMLQLAAVCATAEARTIPQFNKIEAFIDIK